MICDLDDLDPLLALAEEGHHLPDLLATFLASGYEEHPPRNWISHAYGLERRPAFVTEQFVAAMTTARLTMFPESADQSGIA